MTAFLVWENTMSSYDELDFAPYFYSKHCVPWRDIALFEQALELRYQVYVEECGYLPASDYSDRRERDRFDATSVHFCAFNLSNELVGYSRLVRADRDSRFPFEDHCKTHTAGLALPPKALAAEFSRIIVRSDYRRRRGDRLNGVTINEGDVPATLERRSNSPQILLSLYKQMYLYSKLNNIQYWYAAMERQVSRALAWIGAFAFREIGPESDYYGMVVPLLASLQEIEDSVTARNPAMLAWLQRPERDPAQQRPISTYAVKTD